MAVVNSMDGQQACRKALSAINFAALNSVLTDALIAANATVTLLIAAMLLQPVIAGDAQDAIRQMTIGLRIGNLAGAIPETHSVTTVAGLRALVSANTPDVSNPTTFTAELPQ